MPESQHYFEDLEEGFSTDFGRYTVTEREIISFAEQFDPHSFHLDPAAAKESIFGGLVASGMHTMCLCIRMVIDEYLSDVALATGIGFDRIRFPRAVRPGDELSGTVEIVKTDANIDRSDVGRVAFDITGRNQQEQTVVSLVDVTLVERRSAMT